MSTTALESQKAFVVGPQITIENLNHILEKLSKLFQLRIIEKVIQGCSENDKKIIDFKKNINQIHYYMEDIRKEVNMNPKKIDKSAYIRIKDKKMLKSSQWTNAVKKVAAVYRQIFYAGSLKHYELVAKIIGVKVLWKSINIDNWQRDCLNNSLTTPEAAEKGCCLSKSFW